ncbi:MAG: hypothetical protein ACOX1F_01500 [Erysipelotrichaceae bacterium]|jgi:tryptophan synthase beta subunit
MMLIQNDKLWFGEYGGCFVADAFSPFCDHYYNQFKSVVEKEEFKNDFKQLTEKYNGRFELLDELTVCVPENYYAVFGTALLGKHLNKKQMLAGCRFVDEAIMIATVCNDLGLKLKMYVTKELAEVETVITQLKLMGVEVCKKQCQEIINLPEMYAFQEWLAESEDKHVINMRCNTGAFPQVNIASYFLRKYYQAFEKFIRDNNLSFDKIIIPVVSGSTAIGLIKETIQQYETYECDVYPNMTEEVDSFCGTLTKVRRNNLVDRVLSPELVDMYEKGKVKRVIFDVEKIDKKLCAMYKYPLSLQSYAVLSADENRYSLKVVKKLRKGTNL